MQLVASAVTASASSVTPAAHARQHGAIYDRLTHSPRLMRTAQVRHAVALGFCLLKVLADRVFKTMLEH